MIRSFDFTRKVNVEENCIWSTVHCNLAQPYHTSSDWFSFITAIAMKFCHLQVLSYSLNVLEIFYLLFCYVSSDPCKVFP